MATQHQIKINLRGGIAPVGMMSTLLQTAKKVGIVGFRIGSRQQLLTTISIRSHAYFTKAMNAANIDFEVGLGATKYFGITAATTAPPK